MADRVRVVTPVRDYPAPCVVFSRDNARVVDLDNGAEVTIGECTLFVPRALVADVGQALFSADTRHRARTQ